MRQRRRRTRRFYGDRRGADGDRALGDILLRTIATALSDSQALSKALSMPFCLTGTLSVDRIRPPVEPARRAGGRARRTPWAVLAAVAERGGDSTGTVYERVLRKVRATFVRIDLVEPPDFTLSGRLLPNDLPHGKATLVLLLGMIDTDYGEPWNPFLGRLPDAPHDSTAKPHPGRNPLRTHVRIGKFRRPGPTYSDEGRMILLSACCSSTCADCPTTRLAAKIGLNRSVGIPRYVYTDAE